MPSLSKSDAGQEAPEAEALYGLAAAVWMSIKQLQIQQIRPQQDTNNQRERDTKNDLHNERRA